MVCVRRRWYGFPDVTLIEIRRGSCDGFWNDTRRRYDDEPVGLHNRWLSHGMGIWEIGHHMAREGHVSVTTLHVFEPRPGGWSRHVGLNINT
jgi:hypothetical protein